MPLYTKTTDLSLITVNDYSSRDYGGSYPPGTHQDIYNEVNHYYYEKVTTGFNTPNFFARKSKGELLPYTYFYQFERDGKVNDGSRDLKEERLVTPVAYDFISTSPCHLMGVNHDKFIIQESELLAYLDDKSFRYDVEKAAASIYSRNHDTLTFLAELHKTKQMLANLLRNIISLKPPKGIKSVASAWAEGRYGWRVLIFDLEDLSQALQSLNEKRKRYTQRAGTVQELIVASEAYQSGAAATYIHTVTDKVSVGTRGVVTADIEPPKFDFNPVVTAWELIPWSFVLDWLVNVGQAINALSFLAYVTKYSAAGSYRVTVERTCEFHVDNLNQYWSGHWDVVAESNAYINIRHPTTVSAVPQIRLRVDDLKILDLLSFAITKTDPRSKGSSGK